MMFLWELKNTIISTNLRELCDIKTNIKSTHSGFDKLSHQFFHYTVPERSWRHIISIALKSVHSIEHLWCSFENSKTPSFHKISVNFVILKQIQKIHTQWLRQAQPPILPLHGACACRSHIISIALKFVCSIEHLRCSFGNSKTPPLHKISVDFVILKQTQKIHTQWLRQAQPPILPLHGAWACRRHIISIALKFVCSIEHLRCSFGNSKTPPLHKISVNFVILKQIQKIYTQWLRELRSQTFSLCSATNSSITRCLSVVEGTFSLLIPLPEPVEGRARKNWLFLFVLMLQFLFYSPPNFVQKSTNLFIHNSFKEM